MTPTLKMSDARVRHLLAEVEAPEFARRETVPAMSGARSIKQTPTLPAGPRSKQESLVVVLDPVFETRGLRATGYAARVVSDDATLERKARHIAAAKLRQTNRPDAILFLDVTMADLLDPELYADESPLSQIADRVVLTLRGRSSSSAAPTCVAVDDLTARLSVLRFHGFRIALADLEGAPARLSLLGAIRPEFVKIDASLVDGIEASEGKRLVLEGLLATCKRLGAKAVAEGVATLDRRAVLAELGCPLLQGALHDTTDDYALPVRRPEPLRRVATR